MASLCFGDEHLQLVFLLHLWYVFTKQIVYEKELPIMPISSSDRAGKHIAFVVHSVKLAADEPGLNRAAYIASMLCDAGYHVDIITSSFQHWQKKHRDKASDDYLGSLYNIVFLDEPGYKRNIDPMRIISHHVFNKQLKRFLNEQSGYYDAVWCQMPPNNIAKTAAKFSEKEGIPLIVDLNDLWPEAMRMVIDIPIVSDIAFAPMSRDARKVFNTAWGSIGTSHEYTQHPNAYRAHPIENSLTVYVGNELSVFDSGAAAHPVDKPDDEIWVTYAGTLGKSYDVKNLIQAADTAHVRLGREGFDKKIRLKVLGDGPDREMLEEKARCCKPGVVDMLGYKSYEEMAGYLVASDIVVNSLVENAPQSIVSKIADYLASGSAMINTGSSPEMKRLCENEHVGISVEPGNADMLADALCRLAKDDELRDTYGKNARVLAEAKFNRASAYLPIVDFVDSAVLA